MFKDDPMMGKLYVGNIEVAAVREQLWTISPRWLFANAGYAVMAAHRDWLVPRFNTDDLKLKLSIHTFIVRVNGLTILIDTCVGNCKQRSLDTWTNMNTPYLERLAAAGVTPESVDLVFCTHLHMDHVGWNTRLVNGKWVPTFANAKYLFHAEELEHWQAQADQRQVFDDSVAPVVDAGLAQLVAADHELTDGVRLTLTPGHTPGHCSVLLGEEGREGVITGDMIHHPIQIAEPAVCSRVCSDVEQAMQTRRTRLAQWSRDDTLVLGTHFAAPTAVRIEPHAEGYRIRA
ncbi:MAG: MBL fold metallo-hydrolase [Gammaproteobacteria bacterium]|nr:MBL fold metallo-hydrolase [Gammaproteobacteria bacterium]